MSIKFYLRLVVLILSTIGFLTNIYFWIGAEADVSLLIHFLIFGGTVSLLFYSWVCVSYTLSTGKDE